VPPIESDGGEDQQAGEQGGCDQAQLSLSYAIAGFKQALEVVEQLDELLEGCFKGRESKRVRELIAEFWRKRLTRAMPD